MENIAVESFDRRILSSAIPLSFDFAYDPIMHMEPFFALGPISRPILSIVVCFFAAVLVTSCLQTLFDREPAN